MFHRLSFPLLAVLALAPATGGCHMVSNFGQVADNVGRRHVALDGIRGIAHLREETVAVMDASVYRPESHLHLGFICMHDPSERCPFNCIKTDEPAGTWLAKVKVEESGQVAWVPPVVPWKASAEDEAQLVWIPEAQPAPDMLVFMGDPEEFRRMPEELKPRAQGHHHRIVATYNRWTHWVAAPAAFVGGTVDFTAMVAVHVAIIPVALVVAPVVWIAGGK